MTQENINAINKCFVRFLKANEILIDYAKEYDKYTKELKDTESRQYLLKRYPSDSDNDVYVRGMSMIMNSFCWSKTKRGSNFWCGIHHKWLKVIKLLENNNYEISKDVSRAILTRSDEG